jgi:hypothetical protein
MDAIRRNRWGQRNLSVVLLFTVFVVALVALRTEPAPGLCVLGDAQARQAAHIPSELATAYADATQMTVGVGTGAIGNWEGLGEALVLGREVFVRSTDTGSAHYYRLIRARRFQTNSFAFVPPGVAPRERLTLTSGTTAAQLWRELGLRYPGGVLAAGVVQFRRLRTIAISRPAIRGLPIPMNTTHYYTEPMESAENAWGHLVGIAARTTASLPERNDPLFGRLLAQRPDGQLDSYAEVLVLAGPPGNPDGMGDGINNLGRVAGNSIIERGELALYPANSLADCEKTALTRRQRR